MFKIRLGLLLFVAVVVWALAATLGSSPAQARTIQQTVWRAGLDNPPTDRIVIKYRPTSELIMRSAAERPEQMAVLSAAVGVSLSYVREHVNGSHVLQLPDYMPEAAVQAIADKLVQLPDVESAYADRMLQADLTPNDPLYATQWHYSGTNGIDLAQAWEVTRGASNVVVAVVDSGILPTHPDFAGRLLTGYDFVSNIQRANDGNGWDNNPTDPGDWVTAVESNTIPLFAGCLPRYQSSSWHGTHVAGTIGAASNNGVGVAGVDWNARILPVRVLGKCGFGPQSDVTMAVRWAAGVRVNGVPDNPNPARVINLSLSGTGPCNADFQDAITSAHAQGALVVVAAGNNNTNVSNVTPANCPGALTVGATDQNGDRSIWNLATNSASNFGRGVDLSAPGTGVLSTDNTGLTTAGTMTYTTKNGTSMATPHVSGVASLVMSVRPELTITNVQSLISASTTPFATSSTCNSSLCGSGLLSADNAVSNIYVDPAWTLVQLGIPSNPFRTFDAAYAYAFRMGRLTLKPGSYSVPLVLDKPIQLGVWGSGTVVLR